MIYFVFYFFTAKRQILKLCICLLMTIMMGACGQTLWPDDEENLGEIIQNQTSPFLYPQAEDASQTPSAVIAPEEPIATAKRHQAILTITFINEHTPYQRSLLRVVEAVLPQKNDARFTLLEISPDDAIAETERVTLYGDKVRNSLLAMGVRDQMIDHYTVIAGGIYPKILVYIQ